MNVMWSMRAAIVILGFTSAVAFAEDPKGPPTSPEALTTEYTTEARKAAGFKEFTAEAGKTLYLTEQKNKKGETVSCATCHTKDPTKAGKTRAGKKIEPMAISVNKERFTDKAKVEKWFKRNCGDVFNRACTAQEKGDFLAYMKAAK